MTEQSAQLKHLQSIPSTCLDDHDSAMTTDTHFNYPPQSSGPFKACGGYFQSNLDTVFGGYTPWSTGEGKELEACDRSFNSGDRLGQSSASLGLDELVSQIIDDDVIAAKGSFDFGSSGSRLENIWATHPAHDPALLTHQDEQSYSHDRYVETGRGGRKLIGRQSDQRLREGYMYEQDAADTTAAGPWSHQQRGVWPQRPQELSLRQDNDWSMGTSAEMFMPHSRTQNDFHSAPSSLTQPINIITSSHVQRAHYQDPAVHQTQRFPMTAPMMRSVRGSNFSPLSPGQQSAMQYAMQARGGQLSQLHRQSLHQQQKLKTEQGSPLAYGMMSRSPMSDQGSGLGSPASRAPDSPHSLHGVYQSGGTHLGSPVHLSPQSGMSPIPHSALQHHQLGAHQHDSLDFNPQQVYGTDAYQNQLMPALFYGPRGELYYDMVQLSPQQQQQSQYQQYQHRPPRRTGPANDLHIKLEDAYDQFKNLEKERKKTEGELARQNSGKKVTSANNMIIPRLPTNPSRVDRLIIDSFKEHARVITLIAKMEKLREESLHANIHSAMEMWLDGIRKVQVRRKEEIINATNRHRSGGPRNHDEKDVVALAAAIAELSQTCRKARTGLWCALQLTWKEGFIPLIVMSKKAEIAAREQVALREQQQLLAAQASSASRSASASSSSGVLSPGYSSSQSYGSVYSPADTFSPGFGSPSGRMTKADSNVDDNNNMSRQA